MYQQAEAALQDLADQAQELVSLSGCSHSEIIQEFRSRVDAGHKQVVACP